jgi:hypothetical protein
MGNHLKDDGQFQSDKYPTTPRGFVPLKVTDVAAQPLLWEYAKRHRTIDLEFSTDLQEALQLAGYTPGGPKLTDEDREKLKARLDEIAAAEETIRKARKPFDDAIGALDTVRQQLLDEHEAEIADTCEGCSRLLFVGELGHRCADGPTLCLSCSPTWNDLAKDYATMSDDDISDEAVSRETIQARIAAGDGDKKNVWPL